MQSLRQIVMVVFGEDVGFEGEEQEKVFFEILSHWTSLVAVEKW